MNRYDAIAGYALLLNSGKQCVVPVHGDGDDAAEGVERELHRQRVYAEDMGIVLPEPSEFDIAVIDCVRPARLVISRHSVLTP